MKVKKDLIAAQLPETTYLWFKALSANLPTVRKNNHLPNPCRPCPCLISQCAFLILFWCENQAELVPVLHLLSHVRSLFETCKHVSLFPQDLYFEEVLVSFNFFPYCLALCRLIAKCIGLLQISFHLLLTTTLMQVFWDFSEGYKSFE